MKSLETQPGRLATRPSNISRWFGSESNHLWFKQMIIHILHIYIIYIYAFIYMIIYILNNLSFVSFHSDNSRHDWRVVVLFGPVGPVVRRMPISQWLDSDKSTQVGQAHAGAIGRPNPRRNVRPNPLPKPGIFKSWFILGKEFPFMAARFLW